MWPSFKISVSHKHDKDALNDPILKIKEQASTTTVTVVSWYIDLNSIEWFWGTVKHLTVISTVNGLNSQNFKLLQGGNEWSDPKNKTTCINYHYNSSVVAYLVEFYRIVSEELSSILDIVISTVMA